MRKVILPVSLIIAMVLASSVATASDFKATGAISNANGWTTTDGWENDIGGGVRIASSADGSPIASAANETNTTVPGNATVKPTMAPTTVPSPTQTKSPGFEGIVAAIAIIGTAGLLVYLNRKH